MVRPCEAGRPGARLTGRTATTAELVTYAKLLLRHGTRRAGSAPRLRLANAQWNILLDLFISANERRAVPTGDACLASAAPHSTGLRHVIHLMDSGYLTRTADADDARRTLVGLTPKGLEFVAATLRDEFETFTALFCANA